MGEYVRQLLERFRELWGRLSPWQKGIVTGVPITAFVVLAFLVAALSRPPESYGVLFADLPREDASLIVAKLKGGGTPYRLKDDGATIEVPLKDVYDLRLALVQQGLPKGPGVGFELFDKTQVLGTTDAQQRVAMLRALEGELTRTILSITQVRTARVNLALPQPSLYSEQQKDATASVLIELKRGYKLEPDQVRGVIHLVSLGVEGLKPQNVKVMDNFGNILSDAVRDEIMDEAGGGSDGATALSRQAKLTKGQVALQTDVERAMERRIEEILGKVLGPGRAAVKVTAEMNFDQVKTMTKSYEPIHGTEGIIRSQQHRNEAYTGVGGIPGGVPGVESNIPGYQAVVGGNLSYTKTDDTKNYEINEKTEEIIKAPGMIKRLTVAVFVDNVQPQHQAMIQRALTVAAGVDPTRGDVIAVENLPFDKSTADAMAQDRADVQREDQQKMWLEVGKYGAIVGVVLMTLVFIRALVKPRVVRERVLVEVIGEPIPEPVAVVAAPPPPPPPPPPPAEEVSPPPPMLIEPEPTAALERQRRAQIRQHVNRMARQRPEMVAQIIKRWLLEEKR